MLSYTYAPKTLATLEVLDHLKKFTLDWVSRNKTVKNAKEIFRTLGEYRRYDLRFIPDIAMNLAQESFMVSAERFGNKSISVFSVDILDRLKYIQRLGYTSSWNLISPMGDSIAQRIGLIWRKGDKDSIAGLIVQDGPVRANRSCFVFLMDKELEKWESVLKRSQNS